jgi:hypothetical protein
MKLRSNHPSAKRIRNCPNKGSGSRLTGDNQKMLKLDEVIETFSPLKPLHKNISDLHESFLT